MNTILENVDVDVDVETTDAIEAADVVKTMLPDDTSISVEAAEFSQNERKVRERNTSRNKLIENVVSRYIEGDLTQPMRDATTVVSKSDGTTQDRLDPVKLYDKLYRREFAGLINPDSKTDNKRQFASEFVKIAKVTVFAMELQGGRCQNTPAERKGGWIAFCKLHKIGNELTANTQAGGGLVSSVLQAFANLTTK